MYYSIAANRLDEILSEERIIVGDSFRNSLFEIVSIICNYAEEDHRIRPQLVLGKNLNFFFETIPNRLFLVMHTDTLEGGSFERYFKSLALFCDDGWFIVANFIDDAIEYGLFRRFSEISDCSFEDVLKDQSEDDRYSAILIQARNNYEISIDRVGKPSEKISYKLIEKSNGDNRDGAYSSLVEDILSDQKSDPDHSSIKRAIKGIFENLPQKVHGTILVVVKDEFKDGENANKAFSGIMMNNLLDYYEEFRKALHVESFAQAERVFVLMEAFYEMLNTDGITIITTKGVVCGFNMFYASDSLPKDIKGGARKRTAKGILADNSIEGVVGVYFQSQDGELFYERKKQ